MTQIDAVTEQPSKHGLMIDRNVAALLGGSLAIVQVLWIGLLGYGLWSLI